MISIEFENNPQIDFIEIYSMNGQRLKMININDKMSNCQIDIMNMPNMIILKIVTKQNTYFKKIIKKSGV